MDIDWGSIIGGIGAVTGILGTMTGVLSLVKVGQLKSQDLRMSRGKTINSIKIALEDELEISETAKQSKLACLAARGKFHSGEKAKWEEFYTNAKNEINGLKNSFLELSGDKIKSAYLEKNILELDSIEKQIEKIIIPYKSSIADDDRARDKLFAAMNKVS